MEKYTETKDLEQVEEALMDGRRVEDCTGARVLLRGGGLTWARNGNDLLCVPGRIFRIEVPKPEAPDGCELLNHADPLPEYYYTLMDDGNWIGSTLGNSQRRDTWYARKKEPEEKKWAGPTCEITPKMVRVELFSNTEGCLVFSNEYDGLVAHTEAPSVLGAGGYEYEGFRGLYCLPMLFKVKANDSTPVLLQQYATLEDIESGRAVPVHPVAYWYLKKEG